MQNLLRSSFQHRLKISATTSLILMLGYLGILIISSSDRWHSAVAQYENWETVLKQPCEKLFFDAHDEMVNIVTSNIVISQCEYRNSSYNELYCRDFNRRKLELTELLKSSSCPYRESNLDGVVAYDVSGSEALLIAQINAPLYGGLPHLSGPSAPGSLTEYAIKKAHLEPITIVVIIAALTAIFAVLTDVARRLLLEGSAGWKRLTLVVSVASAMAAFFWWISETHNLMEATLAGLIAILATSMVIVYGRLLFHWVSDGFSENKQPSTPDLQRSTPIVSTKTVTAHIATDLHISGDSSELPPVFMEERSLIKPETEKISRAGKSSKEEHHWYLASGAILVVLTLLPLISPSMEMLAVLLAGALPTALVAFVFSRIGAKGDKTTKASWRIEFGVFLLLWLSCLLLKPLFHLIASGQSENTVIVIRELGPVLVAVIIGKLTLFQVTKTFQKSEPESDSAR